MHCFDKTFGGKKELLESRCQNKSEKMRRSESRRVVCGQSQLQHVEAGEPGGTN